MLDLDILDSADRAALVLDPFRLRILEQLRSPGSAASVASALGIPRQRVNYHVRELERGGFLRMVEQRRRGNCTERLLQTSARRLVLSPQALGALGMPAGEAQDRGSSARLVAMAAEVIRDVARLRRAADAAGKRLATLSLEVDVRFASANDQNAFADELADALSTLVAKYHVPDDVPGRSFRFVVGGHPAPLPESHPEEMSHERE